MLFAIVLLGGSVAVTGLLGGGTERVVPTPRTTEQALIPIDLKVEESKYQVRVELGSNVYDAMVLMREISGLSFEGRVFPGLGFFVEEINGLRQNLKDRKYWIYYINDLKAQVGISAYKLQVNDIISWKYEKEHE